MNEAEPCAKDVGGRELEDWADWEKTCGTVNVCWSSDDENERFVLE